MSLEQDLLFCKIAISSGKVTQDLAQKCLALANRFEAEGRKRPQVGAIFLKQNLLSGEDVQRIYGAVQKRMEVHGTTAVAGAATAIRRAAATTAHAARPAAPGSGRAGRNASAPRPQVGKVVKARKQTEERIDKTTLWLGIIFGVIFLGCVVALLVMLIGGRHSVPPVLPGTGQPAAGVPAPPSSPKAAPAGPAAKAMPKADADKKAAPAPEPPKEEPPPVIETRAEDGNAPEATEAPGAGAPASDGPAANGTEKGDAGSKDPAGAKDGAGAGEKKESAPGDSEGL